MFGWLFGKKRKEPASDVKVSSASASKAKPADSPKFKLTVAEVLRLLRAPKR
jgi:hypothetical protein